MNIKKNIIKIFLIIILIIMMFNINIYATSVETTTTQAETNTSVPQNNRYYVPNRRNYDPSQSATDPALIENIDPIINVDRDNPIIAVARKVLSILQLIGVAVGLIMLVVLGIRFIAAKEKPDIKETTINYLFGAFCIFGATGILSVIQQLVYEFNSLI